MRSLTRLAGVGAVLLASVAVSTATAHAGFLFTVEIDGLCRPPQGAVIQLDFDNGSASTQDVTVTVTDVHAVDTVTVLHVPAGASLLEVPGSNEGPASVTVMFGDIQEIGSSEGVDACNVGESGLLPSGATVETAVRCLGTQPQMHFLLDNQSDGSLNLFLAAYDAEGKAVGGVPMTLAAGETKTIDWANITIPAGIVGVFQYLVVPGAPIAATEIPDCSSFGSGGTIPGTGTNNTPLVVTAFGLVGVGLVLQRTARRRTA